MKIQSNISEHARLRLRARAILPSIVELVLEYGSCQYSYGGSRIYYLPLRKLDTRGIYVSAKIRDKLARCPYVVVSEDNNIVTSSYRNKRLWRKPKWRRWYPRRV